MPEVAVFFSGRMFRYRPTAYTGVNCHIYCLIFVYLTETTIRPILHRFLLMMTQSVEHSSAHLPAYNRSFLVLMSMHSMTRLHFSESGSRGGRANGREKT